MVTIFTGASVTCQDVLEGYVKKAFQLIAGHPALDLVNTLDWRFRKAGPEELLASFSDLLRFAGQSGLLKPGQIRQLQGTAGVWALKGCIELRESIAEIFYGRTPPAAALKTLERLIQAARNGQQLRWRERRLTWTWKGIDANLPLWALAMSASDLLSSGDVHRVRACDNPECRWLFLDTSKNHTRRWCDMKLCGNRMKARRFKALRKASPIDGLAEA
jgi:predicted RNA-binding Zn ribbon-like protein